MQYTTTTLLRITKDEIVRQVQSFRKDIMHEFYQFTARLASKPDETAARTAHNILEDISDILGPLQNTPTAEIVGAMSPEKLKREICGIPVYYLPISMCDIELLDRDCGVIEVLNGDGTTFCTILARDLEY